MTGGREFAEDILGRRWDNFASRVAAANYHDLFLHASDKNISEKFKEKLLRLISKNDLEKVISAHDKLKNHTH